MLIAGLPRLGSRGNKQLWKWKAVWPDGSVHDHFTEGPMIATEVGMLEHLKRHYPNMTITSLDRAEPHEYKPPVGPIDRHTYQHGIWDDVQRELRLMPSSRRESIIDKFRKKNLLQTAGLKTVMNNRRQLQSVFA